MADFDFTGSGDAGSFYATLPGTSGNGHVQHNSSPMKAKFFASRKEVAGMQYRQQLPGSRLTFIRMPSQSMDIRAHQQSIYRLRPLRPSPSPKRRIRKPLRMGAPTQARHQRQAKLLLKLLPHCFIDMPRLPLSLCIQAGVGRRLHKCALPPLTVEMAAA